MSCIFVLALHCTLTVWGAAAAALTISTFVPAHGVSSAITIPTQIVLSFNEVPAMGTGSITLSYGSGTDVVIAPSACVVAGNDATCTVANLVADKTYTVTMQDDVFKNADGVFFAGITGTAYQFKTAAASAACSTKFELSGGSNSALTKCDSGQTVGSNCQTATCHATNDKAACCINAPVDCTASDTVATGAACKCVSSGATNECAAGRYCYDNTCNAAAKGIASTSPETSLWGKRIVLGVFILALAAYEF